MKAVVFTLGCKVNEVESAQIAAELKARGFETAFRLCSADIYVLNTCAVTKEAERKSRQLIARALKYNPKARVYVCGCASEKDEKSFERESVRYVCGAKDKHKIVNAICSDFGGACCESLGYPESGKTRAFIKIEDGCNNFCSYCVIPYLRGRVVSRSIEDIVSEVRGCSAPEIVITGINVSAYSYEGKTLTDLIRALQFKKCRLRLGSLECNVIDGGLLSALKGLYDFAPQFHLSLQSGSDRVLKAMNRRYTRSEYLEKCDLIYKYFPDGAITTDIIAGFCGESEEDFSESLSLIESVGFAKVHAFAFSPREGTAAFSMKDTPGAVKAERLKRLLDAARTAESKYVSARVLNSFSVVWEEYDGEYTCGYSGEYIKLYAAGKRTGREEVTGSALFRDGILVK